jgi:hypothetical protein
MREVAVKKAEKDAPPGRASAGEKLPEWEINAPRKRGLSTENKGTKHHELRRSERRI